MDVFVSIEQMFDVLFVPVSSGPENQYHYVTPVTFNIDNTSNVSELIVVFPGTSFIYF